MTNNELQNYLSQFPDSMPIRLRTSSDKIIDFSDENVLHTSETAHPDNQFPEDEWDCEDGKIVLGNGVQFLLFNPPIY